MRKYKAANIKGALLEYFVRQLLMNCNFTPVKPDNHYVFENGPSGLLFINGKGAAHDADVLMNPPIQLPFTYPSRILFECKSYKERIGLDIIRNALGLRSDINNFEIITDETINHRRNNPRANYSISDRIRYNYQVGIASIEDFTVTAIEFAANNKIFLFSLQWLHIDRLCNLFHEINDKYINSINSIVEELYIFLKDKSIDPVNKHNGIITNLNGDFVIGNILKDLNFILEHTHIAINEYGDLFFLYKLGKSKKLSSDTNRSIFKAVFKFSISHKNEWELKLVDGNIDGFDTFIFFAPKSIMNSWQKFSFDSCKAIDMKSIFLSKLYIFPNKFTANQIPFYTIVLDATWIPSKKEIVQ
jgi:hypothetical protein